MSTAKSRTGSDAWVQSSKASTGFPNQGKLQLVSPGADTRQAYLYLKNPAPRNATVLSATLHLFGVGAPGGSATVSVQRLSDKFTASRVNWNDRPDGTGSTPGVTHTLNADGIEFAIDVSGIVQAWCDGATNYGLRVFTSATTMHRLYGLTASDNRPYLEVTWSDAPDAPTELSPAGGSAVSESNPFLTFHYFDVAGAERMASCQVQINASNSWSAPAWDSGEVSTSDPELDLTATSYPGIAIGGTAWWRVRVRNSSGVWSPWSDAATFTRTARGVLSILSPSTNTINDATPEIIWQLTGAAQTSWAITVWDDADPSTELYFTGRRTNGDTSFTLPRGVVKSSTVTYRLRLRVWDIANRRAAWNSPAHTEQVVTFTFDEDHTLAITQLTAFPDQGGLPHVYLSWQRGDAPDEFVIERNGNFVDTVDPVDVIQSDGSYRWLDKTAPPNWDLTYRVRARVNGKLSGGTTVTINYQVADVWLIDPDQASSRLVPVAVSLTDCTFLMPEVSGTYQPIDGSSPSVFVQGQQGLSGTIVGRIVGVPRTGVTSKAAVADMLWMKARPENTLRMSIGAQNLHVRIHNVTLAPLALRDTDARSVSFDFVSMDGPAQ